MQSLAVLAPHLSRRMFALSSRPVPTSASQQRDKGTEPKRGKPAPASGDGGRA
jgi:hypothetical protein